MTHSFKDVQDSTAEYYVVDWQFRTPDGYKNSDIGIIPADWRVDSLSAVIGDLKAGVSVNSVSGDIGFLSAESPAVLKTSCVQAGQFFPLEAKLIASRDVGRATITPVADSILISRMNTIGLVGESGYVAQDYPALYVPDRLWMTQFKSDARLCVRWLSYVLSSDAYRTYLKSIATGTSGSMKNIAKRGVLDLRVAFPHYSEQRAISNALADVDSLLESLGRLIAKKRSLKLAVMQQLLTGETRLPGFTGAWEPTTLAEVGAFLKGSGVKRSEAVGGSLPCVRYGEIYTAHHDYIRAFESWISPAVTASATPLQKGDVLFAASGETKSEIGKCVAFIDDREAYAGGDIVILRPTHADSLFLGYALNTPAAATQKSSFGQGDAVVHISSRNLGLVSVDLPEIDEQVAIASVLRDMDSEIAALKQRRDKTSELKQGMMQRLLTGRTRLIRTNGPATI